MNQFEQMQILLNEKADLLAKLKVSSFDGNIEIKPLNNEKYIYVRKRVNGKYKSKYIDKYSDELYVLAVNQAQQNKAMRKQLRKIEKELAELGYQGSELSPRVVLNIDFARANVKSLIYDQAVLEGVATTFPQTEAILNNGIVNGVKLTDVMKIVNLKHAWEFLVDPDVISSDTDYYLLSHLAGLINEGFFEKGGMIRSVPVSIGGTSYVPPLTIESDVKDQIRNIVTSEKDVIEKAIDIVLYCMKTQIFIDGNKRAAVIFANHFMIKNGAGLIAVPESLVEDFRSLLVSYYEGNKETEIRTFLKEKCWRKF